MDMTIEVLADALISEIKSENPNTETIIMLAQTIRECIYNRRVRNRDNDSNDKHALV